MARRRKITRTNQPPPITMAWRVRLFQGLVASGLLAITLPVAYQFLFGNVSLEFLQPIGRGYEFQLKNETPSEQVVKRFRIDPPRTQQLVFNIIKDTYVELDKHGEATLPGGNISYVPAAEFKELDDRRIPANSTSKFRIPPLSSRSYMEPEATIVDVRYEIEPTNTVLAGIESALNRVGLHSREKSIRYLVINNYWTVTQSTSPNEAIRVACRDDDSLAKQTICKQ